MLSLFIKSTKSRFNPLIVHDEQGTEYKVKLFSKDLGRDFTVTDLLYIATEDICKDKHVYVTRYPIEQYRP